MLASDRILYLQELIDTYGDKDLIQGVGDGSGNNIIYFQEADLIPVVGCYNSGEFERTENESDIEKANAFRIS